MTQASNGNRQAARSANILLIQNGGATEDTSTNVARNIEVVRSSTRDFSPDFVLFSELSTTQYFAGRADPAPFELAESLDGESVAAFCALARELDTYIMLPFYERGAVKGEFFNSMAVIGPDGELVSGVLPDGRTVRCYRKNHIPDQFSYSPGLNERYFFKAGPGFPTFETRHGRVGCLICYERSFPEAWRILALRGAEIIFLPVALYGPNRAESWKYELRTAAVQNGVFIVGSNKGGVEVTEAERRFYGASLIIDPSGGVVAEAPEHDAPVALTATIDLADVDRHGVRYTFFRDRRPELYAPLADDLARAVY